MSEDRGGAAAARTSIDISTLTTQQSHEYQRGLYAAGIDFLIAKERVSIPVPQADDARDLLAELAERGEPDDPDAPPYDDNPYHREVIRGIGMPASRWARWAGALIDDVWGAAATLGLRAAGAPAAAGWLVIGTVIVVMVATLGATPGKLAASTRVRSVATGAAVSWWQSVVRWLAPFALTLAAPYLPAGLLLAFLVYFGSCLLVLFSSDGRAVHDLVAGTIVVKADTTGPSRRM